MCSSDLQLATRLDDAPRNLAPIRHQHLAEHRGEYTLLRRALTGRRIIARLRERDLRAEVVFGHGIAALPDARLLRRMACANPF